MSEKRRSEAFTVSRVFDAPLTVLQWVGMGPLISSLTT